MVENAEQKNFDYERPQTASFDYGNTVDPAELNANPATFGGERDLGYAALNNDQGNHEKPVVTIEDQIKAVGAYTSAAIYLRRLEIDDRAA